MASKAAELVGLPVRDFLYTFDQIAYLLSVEEKYLKMHLVHYEDRSTGPCPKDKMIARNIAPAGEKPVWRVAERHFVRWMRFKGFKYHERGYIKS